MAHVRNADVDWICQTAESVGLQAYGVLDLPRDIAPVEDGLLDVLSVGPADPLIAGCIDRGPWSPPPGDEHELYTGWRYRLRRVDASELRGLPTEGEGSFPDLVFPPDRSWLISLLWDDSWRSIGTTQAMASRLTQTVPNFVQLDPRADLAATGRIPN